MSTIKPALIVPKMPPQAWLSSYVTPSLMTARSYQIDTPKVSIKLDQNESPWDLPPAIKAKVVAKLLERPWNRYPAPFSDDIADQIARHAGVAPGTVLLGPGSNYLIALLLSVFGKGYGKQNAGQVVIARPSFPLYESQCQYEGIAYTPWELNEDLEYDLSKLPPLRSGSMLLFASPNNPVGNTLPKAMLEDLLTRHPDTLFVADEAYFEYADEPYTSLLGAHSNLLLLRTFSKTMGSAGVRIGYILGHDHYLQLLRKVRVPYLLNHFAIACAEVLLNDSDTQAHLRQIQHNAVSQRQLMYEQLSAMQAVLGMRVKNSAANFLLLRWPTTAAAEAAYAALIKAGILVRNVSGGPGLAGCLRLTLGDEQENAAVVAAFAAICRHKTDGLT